MKAVDLINRAAAGIAGAALLASLSWVTRGLVPPAFMGLSAYAWPRARAEVVTNKLHKHLVENDPDHRRSIPSFTHTLEFEVRFNAPGPEAQALSASRFNAAPSGMNLGFLAGSRHAWLAKADPLYVRCKPGGSSDCLVEPGVPFEVAWLAMTLPLLLCLAGACAVRALNLPTRSLKPYQGRLLRSFAIWSGLLLFGFLVFPLFPTLVGKGLGFSPPGSWIALYALACLPLGERWARTMGA